MLFDKMHTKDILQTLEPEMYFLYIPASNQDDIPIFDAGENDLKYKIKGNGTVAWQSPKPGSIVKKNTTCIVGMQ